jgi:CRP-like cAMP-binding protein
MVTHDPSLTGRTSRTVIIADGELVNETVALCLPLLTHRQMLDVTRLLEHCSYQAGSTILKQGQHVDNFCMVASGVVEVVLVNQARRETTVARLGRGEFFGEIELLRGGNSIASIRASSDGPVELVALRRDLFMRLLGESPMTEESIGKLVQVRLDENRSVDRRKLPRK